MKSPIISITWWASSWDKMADTRCLLDSDEAPGWYNSAASRYMISPQFSIPLKAKSGMAIISEKWKNTSVAVRSLLIGIKPDDWRKLNGVYWLSGILLQVNSLRCHTFLFIVRVRTWRILLLLTYILLTYSYIDLFDYFYILSFISDYCFGCFNNISIISLRLRHNFLQE